jgi:group II intron reverse transcriptase/maturase
MLIIENQERLAKIALEQPNKRLERLFRYVSDPFWLSTAAFAIINHSGATTAGVDGVSKEKIHDLYELANQLSSELKAGTYHPQPVRRVYSSKANGSVRAVGIPTLWDRIVQESLRMTLEPIMESHFLDCSTGFRPQRRVMDAIHLSTLYMNNRIKMWWVVAGEIKQCFLSIPHTKLMGVLRQYIRCKKTLALIQAFLKAGISENGKVSIPNCGILQAGMLSPLLANIYLHEMDKYWWQKYGLLTKEQKTYRRTKGLGNVQYIRHAENFIILTNGRKQFAVELEEEFRDFLADKLGLELSPSESKVSHADDGFDFLGFHLERKFSKQSNKMITLVTPSAKNIEAFKEHVRQMTSRKTIGDDPINKIRALNQLTRSWSTYYRHVNVSDTFNQLERFVNERMFLWLRYKHSNVSARESVMKYVLKTYKRKHPKWGRTWQVYGTTLRPMWATKIRRYRINWPQEGNPYLAYGTGSLIYKDQVPIPDKVWNGSSPQGAYAYARMQRLELVGYQCEKCGSTEQLNAHHIVPRKQGGKHTVGNLTILCATCHKQEHLS